MGAHRKLSSVSDSWPCYAARVALSLTQVKPLKRQALIYLITPWRPFA
jgi:hypothetical protein